MAAKHPTFVVYLARDGWRWRLKARNGRIVAESGEAYKRRRGALDGIRIVMGATEIVERD